MMTPEQNADCKRAYFQHKAEQRITNSTRVCSVVDWHAGYSAAVAFLEKNKNMVQEVPSK